ncbi:MAG: DUF1574 family protein, partial [Spirochaetia bacterium]|nr:DUF1574 family protein [Spirochaetia bacterium]
MEQLTKAHDRLVQNEGKKKTLFVFGDSRSFAIGRDMLSPADRERWDIINYAGPQAVPAYHAFLAERLTAVPPFPRYAVLGVSPDAFNRNSGMLATPVLSYGVDAVFIQENATHIPARDMDAYLSGRRWALAGMRFSFKDLLGRLAGSISAGPEPALPKGGAADEAATFQQVLRAAQPTLASYSFAKSTERQLLDNG